ncbi:MAG: DUF2948 family protein [Pseudomonadota bacterium]
MTDARFEEGAERPLRLRAEGIEDLAILSTLIQDAVGQIEDTAWLAGRRRFALLLNRFRWEDREAAERNGRGFERVRCLLTVEQAQSVRANGIDPSDKDVVFALLSLVFEPDAPAGEKPEGRGTPDRLDTPNGLNDHGRSEETLAADRVGPGGILRLVLAGDGEIVIAVEALDVALRDVARPHLAQAKTAPEHRD